VACGCEWLRGGRRDGTGGGLVLVLKEWNGMAASRRRLHEGEARNWKGEPLAGSETARSDGTRVSGGEGPGSDIICLRILYWR